MKRILSIDGGGIRGLLPAMLLAEIERRTATPCAKLFDMLAGTSTGGIIAVGLLAGLAASELVDLYARRGGEIFDRGLGREIATADGAAGPRYSAASLEGILLQLLGNRWLSQAMGPALLVPAYDIGKPEALFFKSWKATGERLDPGEAQDEADFPLWQIARATSAAPTYFPPATVTSMAGTVRHCVDGGVFANNPSACALASARRLWGRDRLVLVSLGTGTLEQPIDPVAAMGWGILGWLPEIVGVMMDGMADAVAYQALQELGPDLHRIEPSLGEPEAPATAMDDASPGNIDRLLARGRATIAAVDKRLDDLCAELTA